MVENCVMIIKPSCVKKCIIIETTCEVHPKTPVSAGVFLVAFKILML